MAQTQRYTSNQTLANIFSFHPATATTGPQHAEVRKQCHNLAKKWQKSLPESPEKTLAFRKLQEAMMYANASIAIHTPVDGEEALNPNSVGDR